MKRRHGRSKLATSHFVDLADLKLQERITQLLQCAAQIVCRAALSLIEGVLDCFGNLVLNVSGLDPSF